MTTPTDPDQEKFRSSASELVVWGLVLVCLLLALKAGCVEIDLTPDSDSRDKTSQATAETVLAALRQQPRLITAETAVEVVLHRERTLDRPLLPDGRVEVWLIVPATVRAGVDLGRLERQDLEISHRRAVARLPAAEVAGVDIRHASLQWDSTADLGALFEGDREALTIRQELLVEARTRLTEEAISAGLLQHAETQAGEVVTRVLLALGCQGVEVEFERQSGRLSYREGIT